MSNFSYSAIKTIIFSEIKDFFKEFQFNIIAPLFSTIIFIFLLYTINKYYSFAPENSYINFLIPGVIMTVIMQTSFSHLSKVIIDMKQIGSFNDYLISPISRIEIFISFILSSISVCFIVAIINIIALSFFSDFNKINYLNLIYYLIIGIIIFSSLGALIGFLSYTWDLQSSVSNFFILPVSFLSGTFFSITSINVKYRFILDYNPIYHLVNGFRSAFDNSYQLNILDNLYILLVCCIIFFLTMFIFNKGYRVIS